MQKSRKSKFVDIKLKMNLANWVFKALTCCWDDSARFISNWGISPISCWDGSALWISKRDPSIILLFRNCIMLKMEVY
jgi:hypothetical protein